jgi:type III secretory pathway component EscV
MTITELEKQLKMNQTRIVIRSILLLLVTLATGFIMPILTIFPIVVLVITDYWLSLRYLTKL